MPSSKKCPEGSVTAEFAVILPVVVLVIAMLVNVIVIGMHYSNLEQAAAVVAQQSARGQAPGETETSVATTTSTATSITPSSPSDWATGEPTSPVAGPLGLIPSIELTAQAKAPNQWTSQP